MKFRILAVVALFCCMTLLRAHTVNHTSKTFMFPRPLYHTIAPIAGMWDEIVAHKKYKPCRAAIQVVGLYQRSIDDFECTRGYFSIDCKSKLLVTGDMAPNVIDRDIRAEWLGITDPTFSGVLTLQPTQRQAGVIVSFNQDIGRWLQCSLLEDWWIDLTLPIFQVKNRLNTTGSSPTVVQSFTATSSSLGNKLAFARITNCVQEKSGIGVIELRLGGTFLDHDGFFLDYYAGVGLPAEARPSPTYLFPATLGNHTQLVVIAGGHFKMPLIDFTETCNLRAILAIENRYYVHNHQLRTFDLVDKPWSRYLPVRREGETATIPAANILTRCVRVDAGSFVNFATGLEFSGPRFAFEVAYQLWGHSDEHIGHPATVSRRPYECCEPRDPLFTKYGIAGTAPGSSASESTIAKLAADDATFVHIREMDINYCSGEAGGSDVQGIHLGFYYRELCRCERSLFMGIGGFVEWPNNNAALNNWGVWGKIGTDF